jgi:hypothetical protein
VIRHDARVGGLVLDLDVEEVFALAPLDRRRTRRRPALENLAPEVAEEGGEPDPAHQEGDAEGPIRLAEPKGASVEVERGGPEGGEALACVTKG